MTVKIAVFPTNSRHLKSRYPYKNRKSCHSHKNRNSKTEIPNPRHSRESGNPGSLSFGHFR
ncbi:hypothetical protein M5084_10560, partial [Neisseria meningitidis]|nr:hypothetical protein [Neisseria meningitidis]